MSKFTWNVYMMMHNEEDLVESALEVLNRQTIPPTHVFVINDGSSDRTGEILDKRDDIIVVRHVPPHDTELWEESFNIRQHEVMSRAGVGVDYMMCMDSDLIVEKDYMERIVSRMRRDNVKYAAGRVSNSRASIPAEAGCVIDVEWWNQYKRYKPQTYTLGLISAIIAGSGFRLACYFDIEMWLVRVTGFSYNYRMHRIMGHNLRKVGLKIVIFRYQLSLIHI